jgi:hypothetical protein
MRIGRKLVLVFDMWTRDCGGHVVVDIVFGFVQCAAHICALRENVSVVILARTPHLGFGVSKHFMEIKAVACSRRDSSMLVTRFSTHRVLLAEAVAAPGKQILNLFDALPLVHHT